VRKSNKSLLIWSERQAELLRRMAAGERAVRRHAGAGEFTAPIAAFYRTV
jgi:hypothetical protein